MRRPTRQLFARSSVGVLSLLAVIALGGGCRPKPVKRPTPERVREILAKGAPFSANSFYACIRNGYAQGLPLKQIQVDCETKLAIDDGKGFGAAGGDVVAVASGGKNVFDPGSVSGACNSGNPNVAAGPDGHGRVMKNYLD